MKQIATSILASSLLAALTMAQPPRYTITDLGVSSTYINTNSGLISGTVTATDGTSHAALWQKGQWKDIAVPGLHGKNSIAFSVNDSGQAETSTPDPNGEDFCGFKAFEFPTLGASCVPFLWQNDVMTPLLTLGGRNGFAAAINNQGVAAGAAENTIKDPDCGAPQQFQIKPVSWQNGKVQELPIPAGDTNGMVFGMNDIGQMVGASGPCRDLDPISGTYVRQKHAVLWQNGQFTDLGSLEEGQERARLEISRFR